MPLISASKNHDAYFKFNAILFDTCGLTWFAKHDFGYEKLVCISKKYLLLIPTVSLYEFGFGVKKNLSATEESIRKNFMKPSSCFEMIQYSFAIRQNKIPQSGFIVINPGFNEWWTARERQLKYAELTNSKEREIKNKLSFDALIHATARNCFAPICTCNIKDFEKLNKISSLSVHDGSVPIFKPSQLYNSMFQDEKCSI